MLRKIIYAVSFEALGVAVATLGLLVMSDATPQPVYEAGLIALFIVYTYIFTWGFDRIFGLPALAR